MSNSGPVICFSSGLSQIPGLEVFLGAPVIKAGILGIGQGRPPAQRPRAVAVWGEKEGRGRRRARRFALRQGLPLWRLEDGFLRSLDLGGRGSPPLSLVIDRRGVYYDATKPSDLEDLLNAGGWESRPLLERAESALKAIIAADLGKYNYGPPAPRGVLGDGSRRRILIVDQTVGDKSVELGLAGPADFAALVEQARAEHPQADLFVKCHPETAAGLKNGYLCPAHLNVPRPDAGLKYLTGDYSSLSLLAQVDEVYTVSSQMGFEALMLGKTVHCFGLPFYAGWGLTRDRKSCPRRTRSRSFLELFAAAYLLYPRYFNPIRGQLTDIFEVIRLLSIQRKTALENKGRWLALGFSFWKRPQARAFLGTPGSEIDFGPKKASNKSPAGEERRRLVWSSRFRETEGPEGPGLVRMEDGFLRSAGLGCDFQRPYSLILDPEGIHYDPGRPSRLEKILAEYNFAAQPELLARAAALGRAITEAGLSKYNQVGRRQWAFERPPGRPVILAPGQVEDDDSLKKGSPLVKSNLELLRLVRTARPEAFIIYKPHPDVEAGRRPGALNPAQVRDYADLIASRTAPEALWPHLDEVHTMTSLFGFEALLRGKRVQTYGGPFYAGWGLTRDLMKFERRGRRLSLAELTAGALILYPRYYDWNSGLFGDPEDILPALAEPPAGSRRANFVGYLAQESRRLIDDFFRLKLGPALKLSSLKPGPGIFKNGRS